MHTPRRTLVALASAAVALTMGLAPGADSAAPQEHPAGTVGAKAYHQLEKGKQDYVKLDLLAINDFHGNLEPPTGSSGRINNTNAGGAEYLATHLKNDVAQNPNSLVVAGGDLIGASPLLSGLFHDEPTIES